MAGHGSANLTHIARSVWRHRAISVMLALPLVCFLLFRYCPLWNAQIAFKDFGPLDGVWGSRWNGIKSCGELMGNTLFFSFLKLLVGMPTVVLLALALYETASPTLRGLVQTVSCMPRFLSSVIMSARYIPFTTASGRIQNPLDYWNAFRGYSNTDSTGAAIINPPSNAADFVRYYSEIIMKFVLVQQPIDTKTWSDFIAGLDRLGAKELEATARVGLVEAGFLDK